MNGNREGGKIFESVVGDIDRLERSPKRQADRSKIREILLKARELKGLDYEECFCLLQLVDPELLSELYATAKFVKEEIYGKRVVLFAPLYVSNLCRNECAYCAFRVSNRKVPRRALTQAEIASETRALIAEGHKRVLLVSGESYPKEGLSYIFDALETIYSVSTPSGSIRRINVNVAPLSTAEFRELKNHRIGTYQLFQETYHRPTYRVVHPRGPKSDYEERLGTVSRAFESGLDDIGMGILFGLYDWRFETLSLLRHISHLETKYGIGPHTISVPRIEPASGSSMSESPPYPVTDEDFRKIIAVLRVAVPYTGLILSTREAPQMRREALALGISQISAGSRTDPGGYSGESSTAQFSLGDTRSLSDVVKDIVSMGYLPSFCTGCYRTGRVGKDFMDLAKPGLIKRHCLPNAIFSFAEYLRDFADDAFRTEGHDCLRSIVDGSDVSQDLRPAVRGRLERIAQGARDVFV